MTTARDELFQRALSGAARATTIKSPASAAADPDRKPLESFFVPPSTFADDWVNKPNMPVEMGMRLVGEQTLAEAQMMASKSAWLEHPNEGDDIARRDMFASELMTNILARACTQPDDKTQLYFLPEAPELQCRVALSSGGVRALWERLELLGVKHSPLSTEATDGEIGALAKRLLDGAVERMSKHGARRVRRLVTVLLAELLTES